MNNPTITPGTAAELHRMRDKIDGIRGPNVTNNAGGIAVGPNAKINNPYNPREEIWAKINGSSLVSGVYRHGWLEVFRDADSFTAVVNGMTGTTSNHYAVNPDGLKIPDGTTVRMRLDFETGHDRWSILFARSVGRYQGQVLTMLADDVSGWDYVTLHSV